MRTHNFQYLIEAWGRRRSLLIGAILEGACSLIVRARIFRGDTSDRSNPQAGLVGHYTLAPPGTAQSLLTPRNKHGGDTIIAFAVLHVFSFSVFWGPVPQVPYLEPEHK